MGRRATADGGSGDSGFGVAYVAAILLVAQLAACGGGGGGGGGGDGGGAPRELTLSKASTYLSRDPGAPATADPRTTHRMEFRLRGLSNPAVGLTEANVEVRRDGRLDVEARVEFAKDGSEKRDVTLVLDVSGSLTADDLQDVKESAQQFVTNVLPVADELRIVEFASPSETRRVGLYRATGDDESGYQWSGTPLADIQAIDGGSDSTALFHAVRFAIADDDPARDDIVVLFSDGRENSSPAGAREEALALIDGERNDPDDDVEVFTVGFGTVDADDLRRLAEHGEFFGVRASLVDLFDEAARAILSTYTLVYDTPSAFGSPVLDVDIEAEGRHFHFQTSFVAGIDLARAATGRYPTLPGSRVALNDFRTNPPTRLSFAVAPLTESVRRADGLLLFSVKPEADCTSASCGVALQGVVGDGAESGTGGVYVGPELTEGAQWDDAVTTEKFTFVGFDDQVFFRGEDGQRRYRCAVVEFPGGQHCFVAGIGLARTELDEGGVIVELAEPPCLADDFESNPADTCSTD